MIRISVVQLTTIGKQYIRAPRRQRQFTVVRNTHGDRATTGRTVERSEHTIDVRWATRPRRQPNSPVHAADVTSTDDTAATTGRVVRKGRACLGTRTTTVDEYSTMALYRSGTPAHNVVHGSHDGSGRPSDTSYPTVTTGRTVLQHDIALLRSRLSVSDTAQLTRPEQENISTATDYKNDGDTPSNTGYQFATTLRNILFKRQVPCTPSLAQLNL